MLQAVGQLGLVEAGVEQPREHADVDAAGSRRHRHALVRREPHRRVDAPTVDHRTETRTGAEMARHEPVERMTGQLHGAARRVRVRQAVEAEPAQAEPLAPFAAATGTSAAAGVIDA